MSKTDAGTTVQELKDLMVRFRDERGWKKHHSPKNLSMSIAIEAAELMEHFQWNDFSKSDKAEIAAEITDIIMFCLSMADQLDIDLSTAFRTKLAKIKEKYPVELFNPGRDSADDYHRIKQAYRGKKTTA